MKLRTDEQILIFLYLIIIALCQSCGTTENAFSPDRKFSSGQLKNDYTLFRNILEENASQPLLVHHP